MKRTISFMNGEGSLGHNTRTFIAANVDADRTKNKYKIIKKWISDISKTGESNILQTRIQMMEQ